MREYIGIVVLLAFLVSCNSVSTNKKPIKKQQQELSKKYRNRIYSPDRTKYIEIFKNGSMKGDPITQVFIHYPHGASQVYSCKGLDDSLKVLWISESEISIIPSQEFETLQKENITHLFEEDIKVTYAH